MKTLLLRADSGGATGTGHVMRCLALAQTWMEAGGRATLLAAPGQPEPLTVRLRAEGVDVVFGRQEPGSLADADTLLGLSRELGAAWIAVDGYHFDAAYQARVRAAGRLLWIDDFAHAAPYVADLVLNQNPHAAEAAYRERDPGTELLLGPRFALLRREFRSGVPRPPSERRGDRVLVTMGGADVDNVTKTVVEALKEVGCEAVVVVGGGNPHADSLEAALRGTPRTRLARDVTDMASLMVDADAAVSAGGTTCLELARFGVPAAVVVLADNQRPMAERLEAEGIVVNLGWHAAVTTISVAGALRTLLGDARRRESMAARGMALVDGAGAVRTVERMTRMLSEDGGTNA